MYEGADKKAAAMAEFRMIAGEAAPEPAHPEVVLMVRELWHRNRDTITKEGANPAEWDAAVMHDTLTMLNNDPEYQFLGLPDMDEEGIKSTLSTYFGIEA